MDPVHPYEKLTLTDVGWPVAIYLIAVHLFLFLKADFSKEWLKKLPRNYNAGVIMIALSMGWFWLLIAPEQNSIIPQLSALSRDLAEFNAMKRILRIVVPAFAIGMCLYAREFLFVRGLGLLLLMIAGPLLHGAMFKDEPTRVLIPIFAYIILTLGLVWVGLPYRFRDMVNWATADNKRWNVLVGSGFLYGIAVLVCTVAFW